MTVYGVETHWLPCRQRAPVSKTHSDCSLQHERTHHCRFSIRKAPVITHFQRKEIKMQKESYVEEWEKFFWKKKQNKYLENF